MNRLESVIGMGADGLAVGAGDGQGNAFSNGKAGPAEVPVSAGNVPATGQRLVYKKSFQGGALRCGEYLATQIKEYASTHVLIQIDGRYGHTEVHAKNVRPATAEDLARLAPLNGVNYDDR